MGGSIYVYVYTYTTLPEYNDEMDVDEGGVFGFGGFLTHGDLGRSLSSFLLCTILVSHCLFYKLLEAFQVM